MTDFIGESLPQKQQQKSKSCTYATPPARGLIYYYRATPIYVYENDCMQY